MTTRSAILSVAVLLTLGTPTLVQAANPVKGPIDPSGLVTIPFTLAKPCFVTMVVDDAQGKRVRNLIAETRFPSGRNTVTWDEYDDGAVDKNGNLVRHRVAPGQYMVRGLVHDGIHIRYEFSVYSPGTPPWTTADGSGAWMAEHTPASGIVYLPKGVSPYGDGEPQMSIGSEAGEAGRPQVWLDLNGRKLHGGMKMWGWFGGRAMCRDLGPNAVSDYYAYGAWLESTPSKIHLFGLTKPTEADQDGVYLTEIPVSKPEPFNAEHSPVSLAAWNGIMVVSDDLGQRLAFVDIRSKTVIGYAPVSEPRGVCYDSLGQLYVVTNNQVVRYDHVDAAHASLGSGQTIISSGLELPRQVIVGSDGRIFVSDWGASHQIKVFTPDGKLSLTIGKSGGGQVGPYDDRQMHSPNGMAIDGNGILWVTEDDSLPRRVSLWDSRDGHFIKAIYGSVGYGGGGMIDPHDPTRLFYADDFQSGGASGGLEFKLDWQTGTSKVAGVYMRQAEPATDANHPPQEHQAADLLPETGVPQTPVKIGKFRYMINTYNGAQRGGSSAGVWKMDDNGVAWPVAFVGGGSSWFNWFFQGTRPGSDKPQITLLHRDDVKAEIDRQLKAQNGDWNDAFITWSDLNGNHRVDPDEVHVHVFPYSDSAYDPSQPRAFQNYANFFSGHSLSTSDLAFTGGWSVQVPAPTIRPDGIPVYDISKAHFAMRPEADWRQRPDGDGGQRFDDGGNGWLIQEPTRGYHNGKLMWTYPTQDQNFPPRIPGQIVTADRPLGPMLQPHGDIGHLFAMNSDKGSFYIMTVDGLFVQTLGGDMRLHPLIRDPKLFKRGTLFDGYSFEDELFHPSMTQTDDGKVYLVAGKEHMSIFDVEGLDSIHRHSFGALSLSQARLASVPAEKIEYMRLQDTNLLHVPILAQPPHVADHLQSWTDDGIGQAQIDNRASGSVAISGDRLYASWRTDDPHLLQNSGGDWKFLFKHGGALDLMIGPDRPDDIAHRNDPLAGDQRLLVTRVHGAIRAVLYRPVSAGAPASGRTVFSSPIGKFTFDDVEDVSSQVTLGQSDGDYEISIPLHTLGINPADGQKIRGDIGLLRGDGAETIQRVYWNNLDTSIVSDVPSEARLQPGNWGVWQFNVPLQPINATPQASGDAPAQDPGLHWDQYNGTWNKLPDFSTLKPDSSGIATQIRADVTGRQENYGDVFTGYINIPRDGVYTFHLGSDDGSRLLIGGQLLVNDDYSHGMNDVAAAISLKAGLHPLRIEYFQLGGPFGLSVIWSGPGVNEQPLPLDVLSHSK